ncbi:hypothetical protein B0H17DRAFT_1213431 [Mycena rosella]|uniref:Uncharacterized protein n=1 Tax=Mycena rosella TaxID=1033263 RepID=A0AAD7CQ60_MYCRO|nr:hypothetical protein B0H17DRAFT_1213431 [Mycena rosella]
MSKAPRFLDSGIATGVQQYDLILIDTVYLSMRLHYPAQNTDPPLNLPYLHVFEPAARIEEDGTIWLDIQPRNQRYHWSFDPPGEERLGEHFSAQLSLPEVSGHSWTADQYDLLRKFHEVKGVDYNI